MSFLASAIGYIISAATLALIACLLAGPIFGAINTIFAVGIITSGDTRLSLALLVFIYKLVIR